MGRLIPATWLAIPERIELRRNEDNEECLDLSSLLRSIISLKTYIAGTPRSGAGMGRVRSPTVREGSGCVRQALPHGRASDTLQILVCRSYNL